MSKTHLNLTDNVCLTKIEEVDEDCVEMSFIDNADHVFTTYMGLADAQKMQIGRYYKFVITEAS